MSANSGLIGQTKQQKASKVQAEVTYKEGKQPQEIFAITMKGKDQTSTKGRCEELGCCCTRHSFPKVGGTKGVEGGCC